MKSNKYKHGITLVEILVVVSIIALLASMVIGIAARIDNQSKERGVKSSFALLEGALQEYYDYNGSFPAAADADPNVNSETLYAELKFVPVSRDLLENISDRLIQDRVRAVLLPPKPELQDVWGPELYDLWGTVLDYRYVPGDNFPELVSAGPDKIFGTADDINNR